MWELMGKYTVPDARHRAGGYHGRMTGVGLSPELERQRAAASNLVVRQVRKWLRRQPRGATLTLLDTGLSNSDVLKGLLRDARRAGHALRIVSLVDDDSSSSAESAGVVAPEAFERVYGDPFSLIDRFGAESFDFVSTQLRVAGLREVPRMTWLRMVHRLARRRVVWVERSDVPGLSRRQVLELAERVGMPYLRYWHLPGSAWFTMRGLKH